MITYYLAEEKDTQALAARLAYLISSAKINPAKKDHLGETDSVDINNQSTDKDGYTPAMQNAHAGYLLPEASLTNGLILTLAGDLGAGKTTFIRALLQTLGITSAIKSPTFSLVESYHLNDWSIHHFDLYRIEDDSELEYIGFRDYLTPKALCFIEWPERLQQNSIMIDISICFTFESHGRQITLKAHTEVGKQIISALAAK